MTLDMQNEARVFGEGDVTIVVNRTTAAAQIFVGTQRVGFVSNLKLELDTQKPTTQLEFMFPKAFEESTNLRIEEQMRLVKQVAPWVKIIR